MRMRYAKFDTEILDEDPKTHEILDAYAICKIRHRNSRWEP
jgi:hypothetical protein